MSQTIVVMDLSLGSSLKTAKPFLPRPLGINRQQPHISASITCRATNLAGENDAINFYKVLSLSQDNAGVDEIKRAYRTMALRYHPDVCHPSMKEESTRMFVQLHAAYKTLSDPVSRKEYDFKLGLNGFGRIPKRDASDELMRNRWQDQIVKLKRRSNNRMAQKDGSWGSRLRAQRIIRAQNRKEMT